MINPLESPGASVPDHLARFQAALADRYAIEREIGRGGMATVYLAHDVRHDRSVALKTLRPELAAAVGPERFLREIQIASGLVHPHILSLHDSGEAAGLVYYVMPYVAGESLRGRLDREKQLPVDEAVRIARELADALDYAHACGVVHRDIKPENVLLSGGHALVADFGIGRAIGAGDPDRLTETGIAVGTPAYMSPEQAAASPQLDGRTDLYSLACVLYEMLAGEPPFAGATAQAVIARARTEAPRPIHHIRRAVPQALDAVIGRALSPTAADRYAGAAQFAEALRLVSQVRDARGVGRLLRARPLVAALALGVLVGGAVFFGWRRTQYGGARSAMVVRRPVDGPLRLSMTYERTPLAVVLADFARVSGRSIVRSAAVDTLRISARFEDQPWDLAFYSIVETNRLLVHVQPGGILQIETQAEASAREATEPLETELVELRRAQASALLPVAQEVLSPRGRIVADAARNRFVITEVRSRIRAVADFVRGVDSTQK